MKMPDQNPVHRLQFKRSLNNDKRLSRDLGFSSIDPYLRIHISPTEARDSNIKRLRGRWPRLYHVAQLKLRLFFGVPLP